MVFFSKANITCGTLYNLCYGWGQRSRSYGRFCEFLHVFARFFIILFSDMKKIGLSSKQTFLMGPHIISVSIGVKGQGQMTVLWILLHFFHQRDFDTTKQLVIKSYTHMYMYINSIITFKHVDYALAVKVFGPECVPFFTNMIHIWGLHRDCQRQITGGLV